MNRHAHATPFEAPRSTIIEGSAMPKRPNPALRNARTEYNGVRLPARKMPLMRDTTARIADDGIVDEVAIDRAVRGDNTVRLTPREMLCVVAEAAARGMNDYDIATTCYGRDSKVGADTVHNTRKRNGIRSPIRYSDDELAKVLLDPSSRARASVDKLRAAGVALNDGTAA